MLTFLMLGKVSKFTLLSLNRKVAAMVRHTEGLRLISRYVPAFLSFAGLMPMTSQILTNVVIGQAHNAATALDTLCFITFLSSHSSEHSAKQVIRSAYNASFDIEGALS